MPSSIFRLDFKALICHSGASLISSSQGLHIVYVIFSSLSPSILFLIIIFADKDEPSLNRELKFLITPFFKSPVSSMFSAKKILSLLSFKLTFPSAKIKSFIES